MSAPIITAQGNLIADPEVHAGGRVLMVTFRLACDRERRDHQTGRMVKADPVFVSCAMWGQPAENLVESVRKGDTVLVTGELEQNTWEDHDGKRHVDYRIAVRSAAVSTLFTTAPTQRARNEAQGAGVAVEQGRLPEADPSQVGTADPPF